jgi:outer membrane scaffolding protein for murein synthesis (MipA/OmpV family)
MKKEVPTLSDALFEFINNQRAVIKLATGIWCADCETFSPSCEHDDEVKVEASVVFTPSLHNVEVLTLVAQ